MFFTNRTLRRSLLVASSLFVLLPSTLTAQTTLLTNVNGYTMLDGDGPGSARERMTFSAIQFTGDTIDRVFTDRDELPDNDNITV
ncbi:MAG: hypothetical protein WD600_12575, partial [Pseudohongiella sp.]